MKNPVIAMQWGSTCQIRLSASSSPLLYGGPSLSNSSAQSGCFTPQEPTLLGRNEEFEKRSLQSHSYPFLLWQGVEPFFLGTWWPGHARGIQCKCGAEIAVRQQGAVEWVWYELPTQSIPLISLLLYPWEQRSANESHKKTNNNITQRKKRPCSPLVIPVEEFVSIHRGRKTEH